MSLHFLPIVLVALAAASPTDDLRLTLADAIRRSVGASLQIDVVRRQIAYWRDEAGAGKARFVPTLKAQADYLYQATPAIYSLLPFPFSSSDFVTASGTASLAVTGVVPWLGTQYELKSGWLQSDTSDVTQLITPLYRLSFDVTISQPLLKDLGSINDIASRTARLQGRAAAATLEKATIDTALKAALDYVHLQAAQLRVDSQRQARDLARSLSTLTDDLIATGRLPPSAVVGQRVLVGLREEQLLASSVDLERSRETLAEALEEDGVRAFVAVDALDPSPSPLKSEAAASLAVRSSPLIAAQERAVAVAELEVERRHNDLLPALNVNASAGSFGEAGTLRCQNGFFVDGVTPCVVPPIMAGGPGQATALALQGRFGHYGAGMTFAMPLDFGPMKDAVAAAEAVVASKKAELEHLRRSVRLQAEGKVAAISAIWASLQAAHQSLDLAQRSIALAQEAYKNRRITSVELVRAQEVLAQAREQEIDSAERLASANLELLSLTGQLVPMASSSP